MPASRFGRLMLDGIIRAESGTSAQLEPAALVDLEPDRLAGTTRFHPMGWRTRPPGQASPTAPAAPFDGPSGAPLLPDHASRPGSRCARALQRPAQSPTDGSAAPAGCLAACDGADAPTAPATRRGSAARFRTRRFAVYPYGLVAACREQRPETARPCPRPAFHEVSTLPTLIRLRCDRPRHTKGPQRSYIVERAMYSGCPCSRLRPSQPAQRRR
jgi:hypothetical protein